MQILNKAATLVFLGLLCTTAGAQGRASTYTNEKVDTEPTDMNQTLIQFSPSAHQIQKINENMTVLQAQLNLLDLQFKVASKRRELIEINGDTVASAFGSKNGNPSVVSVLGLKGQLEALLVFPGGVTQRVKAGDLIDDRRVLSINVNEVILTDLKGKNPQRLAFGNAATLIKASNAPSIPGRN